MYIKQLTYSKDLGARSEEILLYIRPNSACSCMHVKVPCQPVVSLLSACQQPMIHAHFSAPFPLLGSKPRRKPEDCEGFCEDAFCEVYMHARLAARLRSAQARIASKLEATCRRQAHLRQSSVESQSARRFEDALRVENG